jgi:hypothetical protein
MAGYASYRARLGLTIATLASATRPELATELLGRTAEEAIDSTDGYAARDVLGFREPIDGITERQRARLSRLAAQSGLGVGTLPEPTLQLLTAAAHATVAVLDSARSVPGAARSGRGARTRASGCDDVVDQLGHHQRQQLARTVRPHVNTLPWAALASPR